MAGKYALLIGNSKFRDPGLNHLAAPENDVVALREVLRNPQIAGFETTLVTNAGMDEARTAVDRHFANRDPDDLLLFYYTGHGLRDQNGDLYLSLQQTDRRSPRAISLEASYVRTCMDRSSSQRQLIILDCCHSGAFIDNVDPDEIAHDASDGPQLYQDDFVPRGRGNFVFAASSANESAFEKDGKSIFTRYLVEALETGQAAPDREDISVQDLYNYVSHRVSSVTERMRPMLWPQDAQQQLFLARNLEPRVPIPDALLELLWDDDPHRALGAVTLLDEIYHEDDEQRSADVERAFRQRLNKPETLSYLVARPMERILGPVVSSEPDPALVAELETERQAKADLESQLAVASDRIAGIPQLNSKIEELGKEKESEQETSEMLRGRIEDVEAQLMEARSDAERARSLASDCQEFANQKVQSLVFWRNIFAPFAVLALIAIAALGFTEFNEARTENQKLKTQLDQIGAENRELTSIEVKYAQEMLKKLGFYLGLKDGSPGPSTLEATNELMTKIDREPVTELRKETLTLIEVVSIASQHGFLPRSGDLLKPVCEGCPEMVHISGGKFLMGSPTDEEGRNSDEKQHEVTVMDFAIARTEVTFDQWKLCVNGGGCQSNPTPDDEGWGRGDRPVINVSWKDAQEYISWLNEQVEDANPFRLPTEAEWEFAARAGEETPFAFGKTISTDQANYDGNSVYGRGVKGEYRRKTIPVEELDAANDRGLRHMHGNVWEWVEDVYEADYAKTPTDGSAHIPQPLMKDHARVLRGGSWLNNPQLLRSGLRGRGGPDVRLRYYGFRPAKTLPVP